MKIRLFFWISLLLGLAACAVKPDFSLNGIEISQPTIMMVGASGSNPAPISAAAGYMLIKNTASKPDRLTGVSVDFGSAALHETIVKDNIMSMNAIPFVDFPAGALVELRSGSYHVMIENIRNGLKAGDIVHLTLSFEQAGPITFPVEIFSR